MAAAERYVLLGLAPARAAWFRSVAQWAHAAALPAEFVKCLSAAELRARLESGRPFSAALVDGSSPAVERDLVEAAHGAGCAVLVVDDGRPSGGRDWSALGVDAVLPAGFERKDLLDALGACARRIGRGDAVAVAHPTEPGGWRGRVAVVCGAGGVGASTVAVALAQGLGADVRRARLVLLADLALRAEQAMLHDARDVVPGVQELVEAHRSGRPTLEDVRALTFGVEERGYSLLLGLRQARSWPVLRPRAFEAAFDALRRAFRVVVCDADAEWEGEEEGGSLDVEERHVMARTATAQADVVFVVGLPSMKGLHGLVRTLGELAALGVAAERVVPVLNRAPRSARARAGLGAELARLTAGRPGLAPAVLLPERRVDDAFRDGVALPGALTGPLVAAYADAVERVGPVTPAGRAALRRLAPGSLGHAGDGAPTEVAG